MMSFALRRIRLGLCMAACLLWGSVHALEINDANEAQLDGVKGLGPSSTARILQAREAGPFASWTDLMARVKGIKSASATRLSAQGLTVNGSSYPEESK
jgi:competence protein ComEA